jgi:hypothetical protein
MLDPYAKYNIHTDYHVGNELNLAFILHTALWAVVESIWETVIEKERMTLWETREANVDLSDVEESVEDTEKVPFVDMYEGDVWRKVETRRGSVYRSWHFDSDIFSTKYQY